LLDPPRLDSDIDWERSNKEYWAELGSYEIYARKCMDAYYKAMREEMSWMMRVLERLIWFLFRNHYDRVYDIHVRLPEMGLYRKSEGGAAREVVNA
jgi:hypothetical protein